MKLEDQKSSKNRTLWIFSIIAWVLILVCCILLSLGIIPDGKPSFLLYPACVLGLVTSIVNLKKSK